MAKLIVQRKAVSVPVLNPKKEKGTKELEIVLGPRCFLNMDAYSWELEIPTGKSTKKTWHPTPFLALERLMLSGLSEETQFKARKALISTLPSLHITVQELRRRQPKTTTTPSVGGEPSIESEPHAD